MCIIVLVFINLNWVSFMKKEKEKHQPVPEPTTAGGAKEQTSSAALTLQLLKKEN